MDNEPNIVDQTTQLSELSSPKIKKKKHRKYKMAAPLGITIILLGIIGIISIAVMGTNFAFSLTDNTKQRLEIEKDISILVNLDPVPFESIDKADVNVLLNASVWMTLKSSAEKNFPSNDQGFLMIPQSDIEVSFKKLFGKNSSITHQTIKNVGEGTEYVYDEVNKSYLIPPTGLIDSFVPKVSEIKKDGNKFIVKVGYITTDSEWGLDNQGAKITPEPYKYMTYILQKEENYYITSIDEYNK